MLSRPEVKEKLGAAAASPLPNVSIFSFDKDIRAVHNPLSPFGESVPTTQLAPARPRVVSHDARIPLVADAEGPSVGSWGRFPNLPFAAEQTRQTATIPALANRLTDSVNVGTNGGSAYTRPTSPPAASDTVLLSHTAYTDAGFVDSTTDPRGIVQTNYYDNVGRVTKSIDAYTDGTPTRREAYRNCKSGKVTRYYSHGYETAWLVPPWSNTSSLGDHFNTRDRGDCTQGYVLITASARFYPAVYVAPDQMIWGHPDLWWAPNAYGSTEDPGLRGGSAALQRMFLVVWDCCNGQSWTLAMNYAW